MDNNELTGVLFPHVKQNEKQPDYKGSVKVGGKEYWIATWNRTGKKNNVPYMYVQLQAKEDKPAKPVKHTPAETVQQVAKAVGGKEQIVDEVPF